MAERIGLDDYFMTIARAVAGRSTCLRRNVGALAVQGKQIVATGYNGAPSGAPHCLEVGCNQPEMGKNFELCRAVHAEQNVINQAARYGIRLEGAALYCTLSPCVQCARSIVNSGIKVVVYDRRYDPGYIDAMQTLIDGRVVVRSLTKSDRLRGIVEGP